MQRTIKRLDIFMIAVLLSQIVLVVMKYIELNVVIATALSFMVSRMLFTYDLRQLKKEDVKQILSKSLLVRKFAIYVGLFAFCLYLGIYPYLASAITVLTYRLLVTGKLRKELVEIEKEATDGH